ncbi:hypothetical protein MRX96_045667 [Rhipicephalus microplus]
MPRRKKRTTVPGTSEGAPKSPEKEKTTVPDTSECAPKSPEKEKGIREEPGFPDDALEMLISAVDTIVLCVDEGKLIQVPEGCASSLDRRRGPYRRAAMLVLATARFLYIIHNKDNVCKLASWFSALTDLMLPHNLNFRSICSRQDCEGHSARKALIPGADCRRCTSIRVNQPGVGQAAFLRMSLMLPKIVSVHSALDAVLHNWDVVSPDEVVLDDMKTAYLSKCPEVVLGSWRELPGLARSHRETGVAEIECARRFCPAVRKLEVVFAEKQALSAVLDYNHLTSLSPQVCRGGFRDSGVWTLNTSSSIRELGVLPKNLHGAVKGMPALKFLVTDSYDLRLFFEYYVPSVSIPWSVCTVCMVERSRQQLGGWMNIVNIDIYLHGRFPS